MLVSYPKEVKKVDNMKVKKIHWPVSLFLIGYHLFLAIALPLFLMDRLPSVTLILTTLALTFISGIATTAGYHRLYSHTTYKTRPVVEAVLLFFASLGAQGSALNWSHDHRLHHAFVDTDKDPYSIKKGFWHAHMGWLFFKSDEIDKKIVADLYRNKLVMFQHKHYTACLAFSNIFIFLLFGWLFQDYWASLVFVLFLRMFLLHHTTWFINSLAHTWGDQAYSREHSAVDNYLISIFTYGEGYHNYHHTFAQDYRNGIRWYHFDPTKWLIWSLYKLGLAKDLKKVNDHRILRQLVADHKALLLEKIKTSFHNHQDTLEIKLTELNDRLVVKLASIQALVDRYKSVETDEKVQLLSEIRSSKKSLKATWKEWKHFVRLLERGRIEKLLS